MNGIESPSLLWFFVIAQLFGIVSASLARLSEGSCCQTFCQYVFYFAMPLIGIAAAVALTVGPGWWLACSTTLAVMLLTVTCDFRSDPSVTAWC